MHTLTERESYKLFLAIQLAMYGERRIDLQECEKANTVADAVRQALVDMGIIVEAE